MLFIVEIADKNRNGKWVEYPRRFKTREAADGFVLELKAIAPAWRLVRVRDLMATLHSLHNAKEQAPPLAGASVETGGEG